MFHELQPAPSGVHDRPPRAHQSAAAMLPPVRDNRCTAPRPKRPAPASAVPPSGAAVRAVEFLWALLALPNPVQVTLEARRARHDGGASGPPASAAADCARKCPRWPPPRPGLAPDTRADRTFRVLLRAS